jgi:hypothetical protein
VDIHKNARADDQVDVGLADFQDNGEIQIVCGFVDGNQFDNVQVPVHLLEETDLSGGPLCVRRVPERDQNSAHQGESANCAGSRAIETNNMCGINKACSNLCGARLPDPHRTASVQDFVNRGQMVQLQ